MLEVPQNLTTEARKTRRQHGGILIDPASCFDQQHTAGVRFSRYGLYGVELNKDVPCGANFQNSSVQLPYLPCLRGGAVPLERSFCELKGTLSDTHASAATFSR